jgi:uncharacterized protein (TIGR02466 family)
MTYKLMNLFPLTIFKDQIIVSEDKKKELTNHVITSSKQNLFLKSDTKSWTGDINHEQFLLSDPKFKVFFDEISKKSKIYVETLGINTSKVNMYLNRSWGTVSNEGENIASHQHANSHISFAYYPRKPINSGNISFQTKDHFNHIMPNLFKLRNLDQGLFNLNTHNASITNVETNEDDIFFFPSKTLHFTETCKSKEQRVSISGDIFITLKDSDKYENVLTPIEKWKEL